MLCNAKVRTLIFCGIFRQVGQKASDSREACGTDRGWRKASSCSMASTSCSSRIRTGRPIFREVPQTIPPSKEMTHNGMSGPCQSHVLGQMKRRGRGPPFLGQASPSFETAPATALEPENQTVLCECSHSSISPPSRTSSKSASRPSLRRQVRDSPARDRRTARRDGCCDHAVRFVPIRSAHLYRRQCSGSFGVQAHSECICSLASLADVAFAFESRSNRPCAQGLGFHAAALEAQAEFQGQCGARLAREGPHRLFGSRVARFARAVPPRRPPLRARVLPLWLRVLRAVSAGDVFVSGVHGALPYLLQQRAGSGATLDGSGSGGSSVNWHGAWPSTLPFLPLRATHSSSACAGSCSRRTGCRLALGSDGSCDRSTES